MRQKRTVAEYAPELVGEWSERNGELEPGDVTVGSHKKVWWKGACGHEWEAVVKNRVSGSGCPYCTGNAVLPGFNDAASAAPWVEKEWSRRNRDLLPSMVARQSNMKVWWKGTCGHEWQSRVADRIAKGTGCPYCSNEIVKRGVNDITALMPKLAREMVDLEGSSQVHTINSHKLVRWRCWTCGCEWEAQIYTRVRGGAGCPQCRRRMADEVAMERYGSQKKRVQFVNRFPWMALRYYFKRADVDVRYDDDSRIGIPFDFYLPEKKGALNISAPRPSKIRQKATAAACWKAGIRLLYIVPGGDAVYNNCHCITMTGGTAEIWTEAIQAAMDLFGIEVDVDVRRDREGIFELFLEEEGGK